METSSRLLGDVYDSVTMFPWMLDVASVASATGARIKFFSEDAGAVAPAGMTVNSTLPTVVLTGAVNAVASVVVALLEAGVALSVAGVALASGVVPAAGVAFESVAGAVLESAGVALASGVAAVAGGVLASVAAAVLASAAGVVVSGAVALVSAGVDPVVLESVAAGVVVSTGVVLAVVLVVLASVVEPATIVSLEPDSMTVALLLAKSTCAPSFTVLSVPTSSPVEAKNLFKAMALRSGVRIKIRPLLGAAMMR